MQFYPAIDLKKEQCVRLVQGNMNRVTVFHNNPIDQAISFVEQGAKRLHIVDLDGAFIGESVNQKIIRYIISEVNVPIQLGGGIRNLTDVKFWLDLGVARVIVSSAAIQTATFLYNVTKKFPKQVCLSLDSQNQQVMINGWTKNSGFSISNVLQRCIDLPLAAIIHTDIDRDGMRVGINQQLTATLGMQTSIPIIASGGLSNIDDLRTLCQCPKISGVISGRALYDGSLSLSEALAITN